MSNRKLKKTKGMINLILCGIGTIHIGTSIACVAFTGFNLNSFKALTGVRMANSYVASSELNETGEKEVNMEYNSSVATADYFTIYNSYVSQKDESLVSVIGCIDGSLSREELYDYLDEYYTNENMNIKSISIDPDTFPVYGVYQENVDSSEKVLKY